MAENVFVLGLDEHNHKTLLDLPDAEQYRFHPLLSIEELQYGEEIPLRALLEKAQTQLENFDGRVDAIIGFWDFPVSTMVPILCRRIGLSSVGLAAVVKCEHKYWSRLEQQKVIDEYPRFGLVDPEHDTEPPHGVNYPMWVKPIKSFSSALAFGVSDQEEFRHALNKINEGIGFIGDPFEVLLEHLELPPEVSGIGGRSCLAEEAVSGQQVTLEGYVYYGKVHVFGAVDTVNLAHVPSQERFQYPSSAPAAVRDRMADICRNVIAQVGLDMSTFNIEFFWDRDRDTINVLEVNPRHSQSHAELFEQVDGVANHRALLRLALGRQPEMPRGQGDYPLAAKWFLRHFTDAVVRRRPTDDEVAAIERDVPGSTIDVIVNEGDRLSELPDQDSYSYKIANVYIGATDEQESRTKVDRIAEALPYEFDELGAE